MPLSEGDSGRAQEGQRRSQGGWVTFTLGKVKAAWRRLGSHLLWAVREPDLSGVEKCHQ